MKKILPILTIVLLVVIAVFPIAVLYIGYTNTPEVENPYDAEWIIGKTLEEIEEKYGECDGIGYDMQGKLHMMKYTLVEDSRDIIFGNKVYGTHIRITFDEEGKAITVSEHSNGIGG